MHPSLQNLSLQGSAEGPALFEDVQSSVSLFYLTLGLLTPPQINRVRLAACTGLLARLEHTDLLAMGVARARNFSQLQIADPGLEGPTDTFGVRNPLLDAGKPSVEGCSLLLQDVTTQGNFCLLPDHLPPAQGCMRNV